NLDAEVLALREKGSSYAAIASTLGLKRATDARESFLRGLRAAPEDQRTLMVQREHQRLDELENRIRSRDAAAPDKLERPGRPIGCWWGVAGEGSEYGSCRTRLPAILHELVATGDADLNTMRGGYGVGDYATGCAPPPARLPGGA